MMILIENLEITFDADSGYIVLGCLKDIFTPFISRAGINCIVSPDNEGAFYAYNAIPSKVSRSKSLMNVFIKF